MFDRVVILIFQVVAVGGLGLYTSTLMYVAIAGLQP